METTKAANKLYQLEALADVIHQAERIVLFTHVSPDGDTIGSAQGLKFILERLQKPVHIVLDGMAPPNLFFLPGIDCILPPRGLAKAMDITKEGTLAIAVDVAVADRLGEEGEPLFFSAPMRGQIDHHGTNPGYAMINVVDAEAPATAILISRLAKVLGVPLGQEDAICLYTGLSTDTGNFVYQSTNPEAFRMMAELMEAGLPLAKYARLLFRRKERAFVALLGKCLPTLAFLCNDEIAGMQISCADMNTVGANNEHTDGVVDYAIDVAGVKMAYFAREVEEGGIKFSLRALAPHRVDQVAAQFGGGGHSLAAGCTLQMPLSEAVEAVQAALVKALEGSRKT